MRRLGRAAANRMNIHRLSITAAGHASGRVPAEAEARPVVGNSAYRKSTPDGRPRAPPPPPPPYKAGPPASRRPYNRPAAVAASSGTRKRKGKSVAWPRPSVCRSLGHSRGDVVVVVVVVAIRAASCRCIIPASARPLTGSRTPPVPAVADAAPEQLGARRVENRIDIENGRKSLSLSVGGGGVACAISGGNRTARRLSLSLSRARRAR